MSESESSKRSTRLRSRWRSFAAARPGHRFVEQYHRRRRVRSSTLGGLLEILIGIALLVVGLTMLVTPGPGIVMLLLGLSLLAHHSLWVSSALDRAELRLRQCGGWLRRRWRTSALSRVLICLVGVLLTGLMAGAAMLGLMLYRQWAGS